MRDSLTIGRFFGIQFGINWSWLVVFGLIVYFWAEEVFPSQNPGLTTTTYYVMAVAAAFLFFASLLAHEYGHALQARREGMVIEGITLWLFGGVAKFRGAFPSAGAEFRIAAAGPLVTLVVGGICVVVAWQLGLPTEIDGVVFWLGYINLFLLAFNLLPALPLDGGRILRSTLWYFKRDFLWSTRLASSIGRAFGLLFIVYGVYRIIALEDFTGAWLAFIGWFLAQAAGAEGQGAKARSALQDLRVRDLMVRNPVTARPDTTVGEFLSTALTGTRYTAYPVAQHGVALGLLPLDRVAAVPRWEWDLRTVGDLMLLRDEVPVLSEDDELNQAANVLGASELQRALVTDGDRLVGLLSATDLVRIMRMREQRG